MNFKNIRRRMSFIFTRLVLEICSLIVRKLPERRLYGFAKSTGHFFFLVFARHRKTAFDGLRMAFGNEKTPQEQKRIVLDCFEFMAKSGVELLYGAPRPAFVRKQVSIVRGEILAEAASRGRGVILVSAHFGNFPLILARLSLEGYKTAVIMRPVKDSRLEELFAKDCARLDVRTIMSIPRRECVVESIRSLRANRAMLIPLDQNFGTGGVYVDFFGRKAATATGPVVLAQRTGAAIIPCFMVRQKDDSNVLFFEPEITIARGKDEAETIVRTIQKITDVIESYIRGYPESWSWIHKRWKSRPRHERR